MKLRTAYLALFPAMLFCTGVAHAENTFVYGTLGSGVTIGFGKALNENFSVRAGIGTERGRSYDRDIGGIHYDVKPESATSLSAIVDWYPITGSGFRVSGGLMYQNRESQELTAATASDGSYHINGNIYSATEVGRLAGKAEYNKFTPYLGIGWESAAASKPGWRFISDLGLRLERRASTLLSATGTTNNATLRQDVAAEERRVASDLSGTRFRLGLSIGAAYSF